MILSRCRLWTSVGCGELQHLEHFLNPDTQTQSGRRTRMERNRGLRLMACLLRARETHLGALVVYFECLHVPPPVFEPHRRALVHDRVRHYFQMTS
jgi:hypothetical protein